MEPTSRLGRMKELMRSLPKKYYIIGGIILLILVLIIMGAVGGGAPKEFYTVERQNVVKEITVSGKTEELESADLGFASSGRISRILVKEGEKVEKGQLLAQLEIGDLLADLAIERAATLSAEEKLKETIAEQNQLVENAYRTLLSEGLIAVPLKESTDEPIPTITGTYLGTEGQYNLDIYASGALSGASIRYSGLESGTITLSSAIPHALGTKGLYIKFPSGENYGGTEWTVEIPNKRSAVYVTNLTAYEAAKRTRAVTIARAEAEYRENVGIGSSGVNQARLQKIQAEIRKASVYAPFAGIVSNLEFSVGETVTSGDTVVSVVGSKGMRVKVQIPEIDVSSLSLQTPVTILLDAFPEKEFKGFIEIINAKEEDVEGVPVYDGYIALLVEDPTIRTGMTAYVRIETARADNVVTVPEHFLMEEDGKSFVTLVMNGDTERREVVTGITGTNSMVEIQEGLTEGDVIESEA